MARTKTAKDLDAKLAAVAKKYGRGVMHMASDSVPVNRIPFLQPNLNRATEGGIPFGRFTAMAGDPNSGKSRVALEIIAQAQNLPYSAEVVLIPRIAYHSALADETSLTDVHRRRHMVMAERLSDELDWIRLTFPNGADALYVNAEAQFDPLWAKKIGVDLDRLMILESTTIEEIVDVMGSFYRDIPLHVIDSTSNASSLLSQKQEPGKSAGYGVDARQWKMCLRDSLAGTVEEGLGWDRERNMGILIHQMSTNVKSGAQQAVATRYMTFISRLSLRFSHGAFLYRHDGVLKDKKGAGIEDGRPPEADGREIFVKVEKSTVCRPFREAGLQWDYGKSNFVNMHDLAQASINKGLIVGGGQGGWYKMAGEDKNFGQGLKAVYAQLASDEELRARLTCMLLDHTAEV